LEKVRQVHSERRNGLVRLHGAFGQL
jgi:hypothetical protein